MDLAEIILSFYLLCFDEKTAQKSGFSRVCLHFQTIFRQTAVACDDCNF